MPSEMERSLVEQAIRGLLKEITANPDALITDADEGIDATGLDSVGMIELIYAIENQFSVAIADHEVLPENFASIRALSDFIHRKTELA